MKKRLHIVIFDGSLKTTPFIQRLMKGLSERHTITVLGFAESNPNPIPQVNYVPLGSASATGRLVVLSLGFAFRALFQLGRPQQFFKILGLLVALKRKALQQQNFDVALQLANPDILHVQWPSLLPWCEAVLDDPKIKVVLSQRGYQNNVRPFVTPENQAYLKKIYPKIDGFHSVSKAMSATGDKIYQAPTKIDKVVYSGFNFEALHFQTSYTKKQTLNIISVGRPHWKKGYSYALKAMALLKEQGVNFKYEIIGAAGDEELNYLLNEYNLMHEISLVGKISQITVYDKMYHASLFLLPSLEEGLPNVMIEAMALGLPVIATDCGGVSELLDEITGIMIPTRDPKSMAQAIQAFVETPLEHINQRRLEARKRVAVRHTTEKMVADMEVLYFEVLEGGN